MRIYMQTRCTLGEPLRFYHLHLQQDLLGGWTLIRESGIQGTRGQSKKEHYDHRTDAEHALIQMRDKQLNRGYRVVFREGSTADQN
ncbi:MAG: WGR domain-containing protein [Gammaproteobacteria bacterium]|nr:WGR domain-containing protein [Gammaproteobacteria bacterium]